MPKLQAVILFVIIALVALIGLGQPFFILYEGQQAIVTQFGKPIGEAKKDAGLHFKMPFVQKVNTLEKRILEWDGEPKENPTQDKRFMVIDLTARWRIDDPLKFLQTVGSGRGAQDRLSDILEAQTKTTVASQVLNEVVRNSNRKLEVELVGASGDFGEGKKIAEIKYGRNALTREILERSKERIAEFGIELVDVRIKRINYIERVRKEIYGRMIAERKRAAEKFRSEGQGRKAEIEGRKEKELQRIKSEAYRKAEEIRGKADAEATRVYADAYQKDPEFYTFTKTLETYKTTIDKKSTLILSTEGDYFKFLKKIVPGEQ